MDSDNLHALADIYERYAIIEAQRGGDDFIAARDAAQDAAALFAVSDRLRGVANLRLLVEG